MKTERPFGRLKSTPLARLAAKPVVRRGAAASAKRTIQRLEAATVEKEGELRLITDITAVMLTRCSRDLRYQFANRAYAEFLGLTPEQIVGKPIREVLGEAAYQTILPYMEQVLKGQPVEYETEIPFPHAGPRFAHVAYAPDRDARGNVVGWVAAVTDITERKRAEEALQESEARFRMMADSAPVLIWMSGTDKQCHYFNQRWLEFTGRTLEAELGNGWAEGVHPDDLPRCVETYETSFDARREFQMEYRLRRHDGEHRWISDYGVPRFAPGGEFLGYIGSCIDITERRQAGEALRESEERLQVALAAGRMGAWEWNITRGQIIWAPALEEIHGLAPGTFGGRFEDFKRDIHPEDMESVLAGIQRTLETRSDYHVTYRMNRPDGAVRWLEAHGQVLLDAAGKPEKLVGICRDVTERKEAEAALVQARDELADANANLESRVQERTAELSRSNAALRAEMAAREQAELSRTRLAAIVESSADAIVGLRLDRHVVSWNAGAERIFGYSSAEMIGRPLSILVPPDRRTEVRQIHERIRRGERVEPFDTVRLHKDGRRIDVSVTLSPIRDAAGRVTGAAHISHDISKRKRAEEALRASEARFRGFVESAPDAVVIADGHGRIQLVNAQTERLFGYRREELSGQPLELLMPERYRRLHVGHRRNYFDQPRTRPMGTGLELFGRRKNGSEFPVEISLSPLQTEGGVLVCSTIRDVSERQQASARLKEMLDRVNDLYHCAPCGYHSIDRRGVLVEINDTALEWLGYRRDELVGKKTIFDLQTPASRKRGERTFRHFIKRGVIHDLELEFVRKDGSVLPVLVNATAVKDPAGRFLRSRSVFIDLTDRKRAEKALHESEARLQAIMEHSPVMIFLKDTAGRYLHVNRQFERQFHLTPKEAVGRTDAELFRPEQAAVFRANDLEVIQGNASMQFEETAQHDDGPHTSIVSKFPLRDVDGNVCAVAGIVTDITARRRLEADLLEISRREQLRIGQDLHDGLGQQLTGITCLCNVLKQNLADQASPETATATKIAQLLDTANAQLHSLAGGLHPVAADPAGLMLALENLADNTTILFKVSCQFECPSPVMVENNTVATHLFRIAQEAVTNALKHGRAQRIEIRLSSTLEHIILAVVDDGAGFRRKSRKRMGLGLRIMNYRTDMIGGVFALQAGAGGGSEAVCTVPRSAAQKPTD